MAAAPHGRVKPGHEGMARLNRIERRLELTE
jgi:hypothetical protein